MGCGDAPPKSEAFNNTRGLLLGTQTRTFWGRKPGHFLLGDLLAMF